MVWEGRTARVVVSQPVQLVALSPLHLKPEPPPVVIQIPARLVKLIDYDVFDMFGLQSWRCWR